MRLDKIRLVFRKVHNPKMIGGPPLLFVKVVLIMDDHTEVEAADTEVDCTTIDVHLRPLGEVN